MLTQIIAHRGSKGTRPENTLAAFNAAINDGADGIETDVHLSKDGHLIIMHDELVDRTTNGSGRIRDLTLAELRQLDAGVGLMLNTLVKRFQRWTKSCNY